MSKVHKLSPGGTLKTKRKERLAQKLGDLPLSEEDKILVGRQAEKWLEMPDEAEFKTGLGGDYSVSWNGFDATGSFEGSDSGVKSNWLTGKLKVKNEQDANSVVANLWQKILDEEKTESETIIANPVKKKAVRIKEYQDYLTDLYDADPSERITHKSNEERQAFLIKELSGMLETYINQAGQNSEFDYSDLENAKNALTVLQTPGTTWDAVKGSLKGFNWDLDRYMLNDSQLKEIADKDAADAKIKEEEETKLLKERELKDLLEEYKTHGITDEKTAQALIDLGLKPFSPVADDPIQLELNNFLKSKNWRAFQYNNGEYYFTDNNLNRQEITGDLIDEASPLAGKQWLYNATRKGAVMSDDYKYEIPDYTGMYPNLNSEEIPDHNSIKNVLKSLNTAKNTNQRTAESDNAAALLKNYLAEYHSEIPVNVRKQLQETLNTYWLSAGGPETTFSTESNNWFSKLLKGLWEDFSYKDGGKIKKAQKGMSFDEYNKAYKAAKSESSPSNSLETVKKMKDIRNTWKGMSSSEAALRGVSTAGALASFVPGVGAVGAAVTMGADIAADIEKDGFQVSDVVNWNTALNAGFIGLSALGLGGLRGANILAKLGKTAKVAKAADKVDDVSKVMNLLNDTKAVKKLGFSVKEVNNAKKLLAVAEKKGVKTLEEIGEIAVKNIKPNIPGASEAALKTVKKTAESGLAPAFLGSSRMGKWAQAAQKTAKTTGETAVSSGKSLGNLAVKGALLSPLVTDLPKTVHTGLTEGWEYTDPNSVKNSIYGLRAGKGLIDDIVLKRHNSFLTEKEKLSKPSVESNAKDNLSTKSKVKNKRGAKSKAKNKPETKQLLVENPKNPNAQYEHKGKVISENEERAKAIFLEELKKLKAQTKPEAPKTPKQEKTANPGEQLSLFKKGGNIPKYQSPFESLQSINDKSLDDSDLFYDKVNSYLGKQRRIGYTLNNLKPKPAKLFANDAKISTTSSIKTKKNEGNLNLGEKPGFLNIIKDLGLKGLKGLDSTDLANAAMFASTLNTNRKLEQDRIKSVAAQGSFRESGVSQLPMVNYINLTNPLLEKQAGDLRSSANRLSKNVDVNSRAAIGLEAENQISTNSITAKQQEQARKDASVADYINKYQQYITANTEISNRNKARAAQTEASIYQSALPMLQNTAITNFITAQDQNRKAKVQGERINKYLDAVQDPETKKSVDIATKERQEHVNSLGKIKEDYNKKHANSAGQIPPFEESAEYKQWKETLENFSIKINSILDPIKALNLDLSRPLNTPILRKKGGTLSEKRFDLATKKQSESNALKEKELVYKAIFKNNELLLKALSIMFK